MVKYTKKFSTLNTFKYTVGIIRYIQITVQPISRTPLVL